MKKISLGIPDYSWKKLPLLLMMIFIGAGVSFSQGTKTVTTDADDGAGSLRQTIADAVDGDTIIFDGVTTIMLGDPIMLGDKTLIIDGSTAEANVILDGRPNGTDIDDNRVIEVTGTADKVVTLMNLSVQYGFAKDTVGDYDGIGGGGGMLVNNLLAGEIIVTNCSFMNNQATSKGGGVRVFGNSTFTDCDFGHNSALDAENGDGGGVYASFATFDGCSFIGNNAADHGGGALADSVAYFNNCEFIGNKAGDDGGGGRAYQVTDPTIEFNDCLFDSNEAGDKGGGGHFASGMIENCMFVNNVCADKGGGFFLTNGASAMYCTATKNEAGDHAGGVYVNNECTLSNSIIFGNHCVDDGGGVYINEPTGLVENCHIFNNESVDHAGGLFINTGTAINCVIDNNVSGDDGGGVNIDNKEPTSPGLLIGCLVTNNSCADQGGGVYVLEGNIINCTIADNVSENAGGGVRGKGTWLVTNSIIGGNTSNTAVDPNLSINSNTNAVSFDYCAVEAGHGLTTEITNSIEATEPPFVGGEGNDAYYLVMGAAPIDAGTTLAPELTPEKDAHGNTRVTGAAIDMGAFEALAHNKHVVTSKDDAGANTLRDLAAAAASGDTIVFDGVDTIKLDQPIMLGDKSLYIDGTTPTGMVVLDGAFYGTEADNNRVITVMGVKWQTVELNHLTIQNGSATGMVGDEMSLDQGGGLWANTMMGGTLIVNSCVFQDNMSVGKGGGLFSEGMNTIRYSSFMDNSATDGDGESGEGNGGGAASQYGTMFEECTFTGNLAGNQGGGIFLDVQSTALRCIFENNSSLNDGGGAKLDDITAKAEDCLFKNNESVDHGGGIYAYPGTIIDSHFESNSAGDDGGGVYLSGAEGISDNGVVSGCSFTLNTAADKGAGIYINRGSATDLEVYANTAVDHGGGVYVNENSVLKNSGIMNNESGDDGGGLYLSKFGKADNCIITGNTSFDKGGGAFVDFGSLTNSVISGNKNTDGGADGGGVYVDENDALVYGCLISNNIAADHAGGVFIKRGKVVNCVIDGNESGDDGGGVHIDDEDPLNPGQLVGSVVTNNSAAEEGGGVYVLIGYVVNCDILHNTSEKAGGGVRGKGTWLAVNSIIYENSSVTTSGDNGSVNTNTLPASFTNCAIDTTGHGLGAAVVNSFQLDASPFVGGTGPDSLFLLPGSLLVDAGTLAGGIGEGLPPMDLAGNKRIAGTSVDLGVYETFVAMTGFVIDKESTEVGIGGSEELAVTYTPVGPSNGNLIWTSADEAVVTVEEGVVTGVAIGAAYVYATAVVDTKFMDSCMVTVKAIAVTGVELDQATLALDAGTTGTLVATVLPADASDKSVTWSSSNEAAATVADGIVTAVAEGEATITVTTTDGSFTATCVVTVSQTAVVSVTGVTLDQATLSLEPAGTATLIATVAPENATDPSLSWSSSNEAVATVAGGVVTAVADGEATITVTTTDGAFTATCVVTVTTVGIDDAEAAGFRIYPNPVSEGVLYIQLTDNSITSIEIFDALGAMVVKENVNNRSLVEINNPALQESGLYFVKMMKQSSCSVERFIVQ